MHQRATKEPVKDFLKGGQVAGDRHGIVSAKKLCEKSHHLRDIKQEWDACFLQRSIRNSSA
jgi:hypothetical protein